MSLAYASWLKGNSIWGIIDAPLSRQFLCWEPVLAVSAQDPPNSLKSGFENPPDSARPRVWWHWMNGNISKEGIQLDLDWMHRVGIAGFQNFDAALQTPQVVPQMNDQ